MTKGYLINLVGITIWSMSGIFISLLVGPYRLSALVLAFWRNAFVCLGLILAMLIFRPALLHIRSKDRVFFLVFGLLVGAMNTTWVLSVKFNGAAVATVIVYGSTAFTALIGRILFRESLGLPKIVSVLLSLTGCVLVAEAYNPTMWRVNPLGLVIGLFSALTFSIYSVLGKEAARREINPWSSLFFSFLIGTAFIFAVNFLPGLPASIASVHALLPSLAFNGWLIMIAVSICTLLGNGLYVTSIVYLPVSVANLIAALEPVMTAVEAYVYLGERLTIFQILGGFMVIGAVVWLRLSEDSSGQAPGETVYVVGQD
jgi:drug/metabolite transporter (DMT)-like permease